MGQVDNDKELSRVQCFLSTDLADELNMTDTIFLVKRTSVILHFCALAVSVQSPRARAFV